MRKLSVMIFVSLGLVMTGCNSNMSTIADKPVNNQIQQEEHFHEKSTEQKTEEKAEKASVPEKYECEYCYDTGIIGGYKEGAICDNCYCRQCGEEKEKCTCNDFICPVCGGTNTCPNDSECLNAPPNPNYTCDVCRQTGTCIETTCYNGHLLCPYCSVLLDNCTCGMRDRCNVCGEPFGEHVGDCAELDEGIYGNCNRCGIALNEDGTCSYCGDDMYIEEDESLGDTCPECGAVGYIGAYGCSNCGGLGFNEHYEELYGE